MSEVTVDDLLAKAGLPRDAANRKISAVHILELSMKQCKRWRSLPAYLRIDHSVADDFQYAVGSESDKRRQFLEKWQQEKGSDATYRVLMEALLKVQCRDEAEYISDVLLKGDRTAGRTTTTYSTNGASSGYAAYTNGGSRANSHYDVYVASLSLLASSYLDQELDWDDLCTIAEQMVDWEVKLAIWMGLTATEIHDLKENKHGVLLRRAVLKTWKDKNGYRATYRALLKLCCDAKDANTANTIFKVLNDKAKGNSFWPTKDVDEGETAADVSTPHDKNSEEQTPNNQEKTKKAGEKIRRKKFINELKRAIDKNGKINKILAQIMFIGPTGSGKTSLMYRLIKRKKRKIASSTKISDSVIPIDGFYAVTATDKTNWEEVEYDASLLRQLEADEDSGELRIKYESSVEQITVDSSSESLLQQDNASTESHQQDNPSTESAQQNSAYDPTKLQHQAPTAKQDYGNMVEIVMENYGGYTKFKQFFTKSYSLYMRDTGGQIEFQEMVSLLVFGPSIFIFVFRACQKLKEKFVVEYRTSDNKSINNYTSSITMEEALLQSLASVYAMETSVGTKVQRVLIVATHKDKLEQNAEKKINDELELLLTRSGFEDLVLYADKENKKIAFVVDNTADNDDTDFETIRSRIQALISDRTEFNIEYLVSYLLFSLELQNEKRSTIKIEEFYSMAAKYGITGDQVKHLLHFLHLRIGVIQYYDIDGVRHIVIKEPQVLFNAVTDIIVGTFRGDTLGEAREIENGILSTSTLRHMISRNSIETPEEFMKLLVHLRIAAPFTVPGKQKQYFLPCVLNHVPESTENQVESQVMPLAITFKCQHSPKGLFGVLVTHFMAPNPDMSRCGTTFTLLPNKLFKDQVSFNVYSNGVRDEMMLKYQPTHISISFFPEESKSRNTSVKMVCNSIREMVHKFILKSVENLHYNRERVQPMLCLRCEHCSELYEVKQVEQGKIHHIHFCTTTNTCSCIPPRGRYWYNEDGDEKTSDTSICTSSVEVLTDKSLSKITQYLRKLPNEKLIAVGTKLGLAYVPLKNKENSDLLCHNMVLAWLRMDDDVKEVSGEPTWNSLLTALLETGHAGIASKIAKENHVPMPQQVTTPLLTRNLHLGTVRIHIMLGLLFILLAFVVSHLFGN